jgi:hypothetical protein
MMLDGLPTHDRRALSALISRTLVGYATAHGVDLFATEQAKPSPSRARR